MLKDKLKILFATDFTSSSKKALSFLSTLKKACQLNVYFIHVITSFWRDWLTSGLYEKEALQRLQTWQHKLFPDIDDNDKLLVQKGNSADAVLNQAKDIDADLIVLGGEKIDIAGKRTASSYTAEAVVRGAKIPVWICQTDQVKRVLCGIDGSEASAQALRAAVDVCQRFKAKLCIVNVLENVETPFGMDPGEIEAAQEQYKADTIEKMKAFLQKIDCDGLEFETFYQWGMPSKVLLDFAEDFDKDLIVIGAKGASPLSHVLMGSTASRILRSATCSLLVIR